MNNVTMKQIEDYWTDRDYKKLKQYTINDFGRMWLSKNGITTEVKISDHNSKLFSRINGEKHTMNSILKKFNYSVIETESLTYDIDCATDRATQLFKQNGNGVIRAASDMAAGLGTFFIQDVSQIRMMCSQLLFNPKGQLLPLYSKYYDADVEFSVFLVKGEVELVISKRKNPETNMHNLSTGGIATVVTEEEKIKELSVYCEGLSDLLGIGFARVDIMDTKDGLKIVELSVPNFKKFSLQNKECMEISEKLFMKYYNTFYC